MNRSRSFFIAASGILGVFLGGLLGGGLLQALYTAIAGPQTQQMVQDGLISDVQAEAIRHQDFDGARNLFYLVLIALLGGVIMAAAGGVVYRIASFLAARWDATHPGQRLNLFLGIFAGVLLSMPFLQLFSTFRLGWFGPVALIIGLCATTTYALRSMGDILPWMKRSGIPRKTGIRILDTNVIIDGRIYDVVRTGFFEGQMYVPGFVLDEIQYIADSADPLRRQRGRRGLDILRRLQSEMNLEVGSLDKEAPPGTDEVDARLVRLAKALGADIVTNDFNLNRVASLQDITVLNLNDLALAMRPHVLPGETITLLLTREGNQPGQGVGYLDDGTMVVVEHGRRMVGETVTVAVTQVIQTERGRMIFAEMEGEIDAPDESVRRRRPLRDRP